MEYQKSTLDLLDLRPKYNNIVFQFRNFICELAKEYFQNDVSTKIFCNNLGFPKFILITPIPIENWHVEINIKKLHVHVSQGMVQQVEKMQHFFNILTESNYLCIARAIMHELAMLHKLCIYRTMLQPMEFILAEHGE